MYHHLDFIAQKFDPEKNEIVTMRYEKRFESHAQAVKAAHEIEEKIRLNTKNYLGCRARLTSDVIGYEIWRPTKPSAFPPGQRNEPISL